MEVNFVFDQLDKESMLLDIASGNKLACPVIPLDKKPLKGKLVLSARNGAKIRFSDFELRASSHVFKKKDANDGMEIVDRIQVKPPTPIELLDPAKDYTLDGSLELPFEVPAGTFASLSSFGGAKIALYHTLELQATTPGMFGATALQHTQHLMLQVPAAALPSAENVPAASVPWMTVGDCGGELKLELPRGQVADVDGSLVAKISAKGTAPLKRIKLLLLQQEGDETPTLVREEVVWTRPFEEAAEVAFEAVLPLGNSPSELLMPSIPKMAIGSADIEVQHLLRLVAEPVKGKEAWNTMPVRLVRTKVEGQPKGVLPRVTKAKAERANNTTTKVVLVVLLFFVLSSFGFFSLVLGPPKAPPPRPKAPPPTSPAKPRLPDTFPDFVPAPAPPKIVVPQPSPEPERPKMFPDQPKFKKIEVPEPGTLSNEEIRDRLMKIPAFRRVQTEHGQFLKDLTAKIHEHPQMLLDLEAEQTGQSDQEKEMERLYGLDPGAFQQMGAMPDLKEEAQKILNPEGGAGGMGM